VLLGAAAHFEGECVLQHALQLLVRTLLCKQLLCDELAGYGSRRRHRCCRCV
jgi:hypothetical protein